MIVLVSMRTAAAAEYAEPRDALSHDWSQLFGRLGIVPILVPNAGTAIESYFGLGARGLLLTGGDDLGPADEPSLRDRTETQLVRQALGRGLPIFGVCRGLQFINRYFGGGVARELPEPHIGEHEIDFAGGGTARVNSFHEQGVVMSALSADLVAFAATKAGVVEGLRHPDLPIIAVQWHPERPNPAAAQDLVLIKEWLQRCA